MAKAPKMRTAYLIMIGTRAGGTISSKLRNYRGAQRAVKAAKRLGYTEAYAAKMPFNGEGKLKGRHGWE